MYISQKAAKNGMVLLPSYLLATMFISLDKHPLWTDTKYFFMTMWSILTRKTHSA